MRRLSWLVVLLVVLASSIASAQPAKASSDLVAKGAQLFEDQQYEESIQVLSGALVRPNETKEKKIEIYRLLALNYITLDRKDEADSAVRGLLVVNPDYQLPASESPRFRDFFKEVRAKWEAEGRPGFVVEVAPVKPVVLRHGSPSSAEKDKGIDLVARLEDPGHRVSRVRLHWRNGSAQDFRVEPVIVTGSGLQARIPAEGAKPPVVDYYFEAVDKENTVLATRGDAQAPLRIAIEDGKSKGWVLPVVIGAALLTAAGVLGGLALAGVFDGSDPAPRSTVRVNVGESGVRW